MFYCGNIDAFDYKRPLDPAGGGNVDYVCLYNIKNILNFKTYLAPGVSDKDYGPVFSSPSS